MPRPIPPGMRTAENRQRPGRAGRSSDVSVDPTRSVFAVRPRNGRIGAAPPRNRRTSSGRGSGPKRVGYRQPVDRTDPPRDVSGDSEASDFRGRTENGRILAPGCQLGSRRRAGKPTRPMPRPDVGHLDRRHPAGHPPGQITPVDAPDRTAASSSAGTGGPTPGHPPAPDAPNRTGRRSRSARNRGNPPARMPPTARAAARTPATPGQPTDPDARATPADKLTDWQPSNPGRRVSLPRLFPTAPGRPGNRPGSGGRDRRELQEFGRGKPVAGMPRHRPPGFRTFPTGLVNNVLPARVPGLRVGATPLPGFHTGGKPISLPGFRVARPISLVRTFSEIWLNPISVAAKKPYLLRLPEADYVAYAASAVRRRCSMAQYLRDCIRVGARQLAGEKAVAPVQNKPVPVPRLPAAPIGRVVADGKCMADVAFGTHCKICGRVHR